MKSILGLTFFFIFTLSLCANSEKNKSFKAEQFNHRNSGCPMNSNCSKDAGAVYSQWVRTLNKSKKSKTQTNQLNNLATRVGLPFTQWVTSKGSFSEELIVWDSHCRNHNIEGQARIHIGLQFINNTAQSKKLETEGLALNRIMLIQDQTGKISTRLVPRTDTPLYFDGDNLIYQIEFEGNYFAISLDKNGNLSVVNTTTPKEFPQTIDCPKDLLASANQTKEQATPNLYLGNFCQRTWDKQTGLFKTILLPWSCN